MPSRIYGDTPAQPGAMKRAFLDSVKTMWPHGPDNPIQHRDIILVYTMGWVDALKQAGCVAELRTWVEECRPIASEGWLPDDTWRWW